MSRTTIEVEPIVRKAIKVVAKKHKVRMKVATNILLRWALPQEATIFTTPTPEMPDMSNRNTKPTRQNK